MSLRIGAVPYGVGAPLVAGLAGRSDVSLVEDAPSRLIARLRAGELDAALVSSIEAFRRPGYRVVRDVGICCNGAVRSVRAFRRRAAERILRVGLDDASETSSALLRVLLAREFPEPERTFERIPATTRPDDLPHDLVMMIGDPGLEADPGEREVWDLGEKWHAWTGAPFVFALWLIAPDAPAAQAAALLGHAPDPAKHDDGTGGAVYYRVGPRELDGLERFHLAAAELGLADPAIQLEFAASSATQHS